MLTPKQAIERLKEGNERFIEESYQADYYEADGTVSADGATQITPKPGSVRGHQMMLSQNPFAILLGCADSRVPAEMVFDQGLGDLFVIRVAGNVVAPSGIGSIEFAVEKFGTNLVVVLGHTRCGAIEATVDAVQHPNELSPNLASIVNRIRPAVESVVKEHPNESLKALCTHAMRANVEASVAALSAGSEIIEDLIQKDELLIVGAEYSVESGKVDFIEFS